MKNFKLTIVFLLVLISGNSIAQNSIAPSDDMFLAVLGDNPEKIKDSEMELLPPRFMGGQEELNSFIKANLKYPELAIRQGLEGTVQVLFKITAEGLIEDVTVKNPSKNMLSLSAAAVDLISKMPKWYPATMGGNSVDVYYQLPIRFDLH
jgi:periplasmic protein TonB